MVTTPVSTAQPSSWPTAWTPLDTDPVDCGTGREHRDVIALFYAVDSDYMYLRMETSSPAGWPSTAPAGEARYKWWIDTNLDAYVSGTSVYKAEFLLMLEDLSDPNSVPYNRDKLGELTLMDDLANVGFQNRWNSTNPPDYVPNTPDTSPSPSPYWRRVYGTGTAGTGGPQGIITDPDIGYRVNGSYVDMYVSWDVLGDPAQVCVIWATDNHDPNLDQAPNCDRPQTPLCFSILCPVTFYTDPTTVGSITFQSVDYTNGGSTSVGYGTSDFATANAPVGWSFDHWEVTGNVAFASGFDSWDNPTKIDVTCGGSLKAVFTEVPPAPPPSVGGFALPITLDLGTSNSLFSQIGLASALSAIVAATIILVRRRMKTSKLER